jgi:hypothetical protein
VQHAARKTIQNFFMKTGETGFTGFLKIGQTNLFFFGENRLQKFEVTRHLKFSKV